MPRKKKRAIGVLDCETDPFEPGVSVQPFIWGVLLDDGTYREFFDTEECADYLATLDAIVYAHNGGKFDYHFLRKYFESETPISVIAGRVSKAFIGKCELRDSLNLFSQTRLADFSKLKFDYRWMRKGEREKHMPEIRHYLRDDCNQLMTMVTNFLERYGMQFTQAGAAMKYWRKTGAPQGFVPQSSAAYYDQFSPFYYGGRVQCFTSGHVREPFKVVDINSAYPRAMCDPHPYTTQPLRLSKLPKDESLIPQALIELDAISGGALPLRNEDDHSLYFPEDERTVRRYRVTGWEYLAGLETGTLRPQRIIACHLFGQPVNFKSYVDHFYNMRKEAKQQGDKLGDIFAKIFMNGLYGKFASNPRNYDEYILSDPHGEAYKHWLEAGYEDRGTWGERAMLTRPLPEMKQRFFNIVTGASITGWVRAYLWRSLQKVSGPLYCDTDSISARDVGRLDLGKDLGQWKLEAECDEYAIAGKKLYAFHVTGTERDESSRLRRQMPLDTPDSLRDRYDDLRKSWKVACKGSDLSPAEIIQVATGDKVQSVSQVPNYSIHKNDIGFINRDVRSTFKDVRKFPDAQTV